jgi:biopolymer transport protein ExbD/biopolymer transport protein TolR
MLQSWRKLAKLFSDFNTLQFAGVMGMVLFVILLVFMEDTRPHHLRWVAVDLPKVRQPVSMRDADREDAMIIVVTRDERVFLGNDLLTLDVLSMKIADRLHERGVEQRVYLNADARASWGAVKPVLDAVRAAGIVHIAILTEQRHTAALHMELAESSL